MKKALALLLALVMLLSLVACGAAETPTEPKTDDPVVETPDDGGEETPAVEEGKVFNIYAWNEEFKGFFEKYY